MRPLIHPKVRPTPARALACMSAALFATALLWSTAAASAEGAEPRLWKSWEDKVPEHSNGVDTGLDIQPGDRVVIKGAGQIWSGVAFTLANDADGWNKDECNPNFPLNKSPLNTHMVDGKRCSRPFSLIGRWGRTDNHFLVGKDGGLGPYDQIYDGPPVRLYLRANDDVPGNGNGAFTAKVEVYRVPADRDNDGVPDDVDKCPDKADPNQFDSDNDGLGDVCDPTPHGDNPGGGGPDQGYFRVSVLGFTVNQHTDDHPLNWDGKGDEVFIQSLRRELDKDGKETSPTDTFSTPVMGDVNGYAGRIRAGNAAGGAGGLEAGDSFPTSTPWLQSGGLTNDPPRGERIIPPFSMGTVKLVDGENLAQFTPIIWEWDGGTDFFNRFLDVALEHGPAVGKLATIISGNSESADGIYKTLEQAIPLARNIVRDVAIAMDRPVGAKKDGDGNYLFEPQTLGLTYRKAVQTSESTGQGGRGVRAMEFKDDADLGGGHYTLWYRVDRLSAPPANGGGDTTPPRTTIHSGPRGAVNSRSAVFAFSSSEAGSTFECSLDGGQYQACSSPKRYASLGDGRHKFQVRAKDRAGNLDPVGAFRTWEVDTKKPRISATVPRSGATGVLRSANVVGTFSEPMRRNTLTRATVTLRRAGTNTRLPATLGYPAANKVVLNPSTSLRPGTYVAMIGTGARDRVGNPLDQNPRVAGNQPKVWSFRVGR